MFSSMQSVVKNVLPREDLQKKYVVETCLKEQNALLSTFRTEEKRVRRSNAEMHRV